MRARTRNSTHTSYAPDPEYDDPRIQDLPFVRDDLQRVRDILLNRGFQSAEIVESKRGITPNTVNGRIRGFLRGAGPGDTLFVLLSGHGQHFEGKDYLIPEDATFDVQVFADSCIEIGWEQELEDSPAGHVVFLVDACREGIDRDSMAAPPGVQPWSRRKVANALRREVASTATAMGIRHELETWFTQPHPEPADASAAAAPPA
ncbi:caspase family protein [Streptomyces sp. NBC_00878]|uniref:caspase family protein n=1 Tax=Streptomyces sp. NBC_00878 TaxID=2975854 RepID=UPI002254A6C3|nr:caspase family protein [Streptomyces sp. NBC_00878]MCX4906585.1 caspase family protein [Streptomyces sp. NBC_00878]